MFTHSRFYLSFEQWYILIPVSPHLITVCPYLWLVPAGWSDTFKMILPHTGKENIYHKTCSFFWLKPLGNFDWIAIQSSASRNDLCMYVRSVLPGGPCMLQWLWQHFCILQQPDLASFCGTFIFVISWATGAALQQGFSCLGPGLWSFRAATLRFTDWQSCRLWIHPRHFHRRLSITVFMQVFALSFKRYHHFLIFLGYVVAVF